MPRSVAATSEIDSQVSTSFIRRMSSAQTSRTEPPAADWRVRTIQLMRSGRAAGHCCWAGRAAHLPGGLHMTIRVFPPEAPRLVPLPASPPQPFSPPPSRRRCRWWLATDGCSAAPPLASTGRRWVDHFLCWRSDGGVGKTLRAEPGNGPPTPGRARWRRFPGRTAGASSLGSIYRMPQDLTGGDAAREVVFAGRPGPRIGRASQSQGNPSRGHAAPLDLQSAARARDDSAPPGCLPVHGGVLPTRRRLRGRSAPSGNCGRTLVLRWRRECGVAEARRPSDLYGYAGQAS